MNAGLRVEHDGKQYVIHAQGSWKALRVYEVRPNGLRKVEAAEAEQVIQSAVGVL